MVLVEVTRSEAGLDEHFLYLPVIFYLLFNIIWVLTGSVTY